MGLDNSQVVDAISTDPAGKVTLSLFDAWDWEAEGTHLYALQAKINSYFAFVQSGQLLESYPSASGKQVIIDVVSKFPIPPKAEAFFRHVDGLATRLNARVFQRVLNPIKGLESE